MPKLSEAAVAVLGSIVSMENATVYGTSDVEGVKCLVHTGDGYAQVKIKTELANKLKPTIGQTVAWFVRYGANRSGDAANAYSSFVGPVTPDFIDALNSAVRKQPAAA